MNAEFEAFQNGTPGPFGGQARPEQGMYHGIPLSERPEPRPPHAPRMSYVKLAGHAHDPIDFGQENPPLRRWRSGSNWAQDFKYLAVESSGVRTTAGRPRGPAGPSTATIEFPQGPDPNPGMLYKGAHPMPGPISASRNAHRHQHQTPAFEDAPESAIYQPRAVRPTNFNYAQQSPLQPPNQMLFQQPSSGDQLSRQDRTSQFVAEQQEEQQRAFEREFDSLASVPNTLDGQHDVEKVDSIAKPGEKTEVADSETAKPTEKPSNQLGHDHEYLGDVFEPAREHPPVKQSDADELAKTAGQFVELLSSETSKKFEDSNFMAFMRVLRDEEVRVEGASFVDAEGKALENPDVDVQGDVANVGLDHAQTGPLAGDGVTVSSINQYASDHLYRPPERVTRKVWECADLECRSTRVVQDHQSRRVY